MLKNDESLKTIKKIGVGITILILLFSIISMVVVIFIYNGQFPRYERHDMTISAGLRYDDLKDNFPRNLVNFKSGENNLQGYVYGNDLNQGLVVVSHGIGGGADSYLPQIKHFVEQGFRVFAYDSTGSFDSEGKTTRGFPQSLLDLDAALTYINLQSEFDGLPVLLFGHSWGGYAVANILHFDYEIASIVTVSAANSPMEIIIEQGRNMMGGFIDIQYPFLWFYQRILFGKTASLSAVDAINKSDVPVLIIHGLEDDFILYDGSSIISNSNEINNPGVKYISLKEPDRNGHNNLFRSNDSIDYIAEINVEYRELYDSHNQSIPYAIKQDFYSGVNRALAQDLDKELMDNIIEFFMDSIKSS